jgi:hypothetical protein
MKSQNNLLSNLLDFISRAFNAKINHILLPYPQYRRISPHEKYVPFLFF